MRTTKGISNNFILLILRIILLYLLYTICRIVFYYYNYDLIGVVKGDDFLKIAVGGFLFDSASILYINLLFIFISLIPFYFKEKNGWQNLVSFVYVFVNAAGLLLNVTDIFYYKFKLAKIASDDLHYLYEDNMVQLLPSFIKDYWWGFVMWIAMVLILYIVGCRVLKLKPKVRVIAWKPAYYFMQIFALAFSIGFAIFAIRGFSVSKSAFPISVSDAALYAKPQHTSLILSNPFCLIRTINKRVHSLKFYDDEKCEELFSTTKQPVSSAAVRLDKPNVMLIVLESFGNGHIKSLSDQYPKDAISCTPFIDSLFNNGLLFTNAYQGGNRSIDAMPAIWGSIPSLKENFLSLPHSSGKYYALGNILGDMGYSTYFLHGAGRSSMSFVSFGEMTGIKNFISREDYEKENGTGDFDGKWGIWDHKFLPYAADKISGMQEPFFTTLYTLSSHHPFALPKEYEGKFYDNPKAPIEKTIAYSDMALKDFFEKIKHQKWFDSTLFIITADHGSGADNDKYSLMPYSHNVPIFYYMPKDSTLRSERIGRITSHLDITPTLLSMLSYDKPIFSFGKDAINSSSSDAKYMINYSDGVYNIITDSLMYQFNEKDVMGVYNYKTDYLKKHNLLDVNVQYPYIDTLKGYLQQYHKALETRKYVVE